MTSYKHTSFRIECAGINVRICCDDDSVYRFLFQNLGAMRSRSDGHSDIEYVISGQPGKLSLRRHNCDRSRDPVNFGELIYELESDLVVQLQLLRPDLLFLHAAVLTDGRSCHVITGASGAGKSTTCWGMLHHGLKYVSDELAPIVLPERTVFPYSHALCLKRRPPGSYPLPPRTVTSERGFHIPPDPTDPSRAASSPEQPAAPVRSLIFIEYSKLNRRPVVTPVDHAEAAARLYPNVLNALAHPHEGLAAVSTLTKDLRCFRLDAGELGSTCEMLAGLLCEPQDMIPPQYHP